MEGIDEDLWDLYQRERLTWYSATTGMRTLIQYMDAQHINNCINLLKKGDERYDFSDTESWINLFQYELERKKNAGFYEIT